MVSLAGTDDGRGLSSVFEIEDQRYVVARELRRSEPGQPSSEVDG
jgi:hypothetical protein